MELNFEMHISPSEVRIKSCINCMNGKIQAYTNSTGYEYVNVLCLISQDVMYDNDTVKQAKECTAFEPCHWETIRSNDYRKLT